MKGINLQIIELKENLAEVINKSGLPITVTQMALFELSTQINGLVTQQVDAERKASAEEGDKQNGKEIHKD